MRPFIFILTVALMSGCFEKGDCVVNNTNLVKVAFKKLSDKKTATVTMTSVEVEGTAIVLYENAAVSAVELPVDPGKTETTFIFNYAGEQQRITFSYINQTVIPSEACGAFLYQKDVVITSTTYPEGNYKSVNAQLLKDVVTNFEIYL